MTILVPSYKENVAVVRHTLLSAALQYYPDKHVTLLIDDPPNLASPSDREAIEAMRALPIEIQHLLDEVRVPLEKEFTNYLGRCGTEIIDLEREGETLARQYQEVAGWFSHLSATYHARDHGGKLLIEKVFRNLAHAHHEKALSLLESASRRSLSEQEILCHYRRLASMFRVRLSSFERKRYINLSHEPNKAMNLNISTFTAGISFT